MYATYKRDTRILRHDPHSANGLEDWSLTPEQLIGPIDEDWTVEKVGVRDEEELSRYIKIRNSYLSQYTSFEQFKLLWRIHDVNARFWLPIWIHFDEQMQRLNVNKPKLTGANILKPPCITYFHSVEFANLKDYRKNVLFIMANYYAGVNSGDEQETLNTILDWNKVTLGGHLTYRQMVATTHDRIENFKRGRYAGCTHIKKILRLVKKSSACMSCPYDR